jgi:hypothetical protein
MSDKLTFYASFGSGYRRTELDYDDMGVSQKPSRHPVFPDKIDGRGYVEVIASSVGRARYLARTYFRNEYSGIYITTDMWDRWDSGYRSSAASFLRENGTLVLGVLDEDGLHWEKKN